MRRALLLAAFLAAAGPVLAAAAGPAAADEPAKSEFWKEREAEYRGSPRGPFTAVFADYVDLGAAVVVIAGKDGVSAEEAAPGKPEPKAHAVRIALGADGFTAAGVEGWAAATLHGADIGEETKIGEGAGDEQDLRLGKYLLSLDLQGPEVGRILAYDPVLLKDFHGFPVFPDNDAFRVTARVVPGDGATVQLGTTRGLEKPFVRAAVLQFDVGGTPCRLTGYRGEGDEEGVLFVPFRDATSGGASYKMGRYLRVEPNPDGSADIDFNRATNPWCAYSPYYNCVRPPEENLLPVAIRAGERKPEGH